ncbi:unnamed protein product [Mytilus edulis]|uniref:CCHC-type domain-containing protein n=1 Tax=Mytilus edulis TaxID=6550 RepID=A0A8S3QND2_MYTED|nr:unnamed protein product [Mytilus edulis]
MGNLVERLARIGQQATRPKPPLTCYFCGIAGHIKRECRKYLASKGRQQGRPGVTRANTRTHTQGTQTHSGDVSNSGNYPSNGVVPLRIANMSDSERVVYVSTRIAKCETFVIAQGLFLDNDTEGRLHMVKDTKEEEDQGTKSTNLPDHLVDVFNSSSPSLTPDQTSQLKSLLKRHSDAFAKSKKDLGCCDLIEHKIDTVASVKHLHHYLYGVSYLVRTDHGALNWLLNFKNPEGQMARWLEVLASYNFTIQHRPGKQHSNADGLSRQPCTTCSYCSRQEEKDESNSESDNIQHLRVTKTEKEPEILGTEEEDTEDSDESLKWVDGRSREEISRAQQADKILGQLWKLKKDSPTKPKWESISEQSRVFKVYWSQWDRIKLTNGILYRDWISKTKGEISQLLLPACWQDEVLRMLHDDPAAGHFGQHRTMARVSRRFYWVYKWPVMESPNPSIQKSEEAVPEKEDENEQLGTRRRHKPAYLKDYVE